MNLKTNMLIANGKIITPDVVFCKNNPSTRQYDVQFKNGKTYHYNYCNLRWLKDPKVLNPALYKLYRNGRELFSVEAIYVFSEQDNKYWHVCFENGLERDYFSTDLVVETSCFSDEVSKNVFEYLKQIADLVSLRTEDGTKLLSQQYEKIDFISKDKAIAPYLNTQEYVNPQVLPVIPIFPFGCNASQYKAVKAALENKISIIEGPPGTGKTQTILNIIANLLVSHKTVQVVSSNNSATKNILEKLALPKYGMDFIVAPLGSSENKANFIENQTGKYPDLSAWKDESIDLVEFLQTLQNQSEKLQIIFKKQEQLAKLKQELDILETEIKHFNLYLGESDIAIEQFRIPKRFSAKQIMDLWQILQPFSESEKQLPLLLRLKLYLLGIRNWDLYKKKANDIISVFQKLYYKQKQSELTNEIAHIQQELSAIHSDTLLKDFSEQSMRYLKSELYHKYGGVIQRKVFEKEDFYRRKIEFQQEYPVVLSTTFSARSSLCANAFFDYVIMDEASQVDVATGALALSCAQKAVIVGDRRQLPNVVKGYTEKRADAIFQSYQLPESYSYAHKSFLQSVCELLPEAPVTLLREHYRCHPKIINFCNQKFYNGELVIMTEDHGEKDVLTAIKTVCGEHKRGHMNQRQVDVVCQEVLPKLTTAPEEIGVIAPYNEQVQSLKDAISNPAIEVDTVHKFQGREKDSIVLTTVDDEVTDFSDNPYLLNVAVSRAKRQLCLVASGNEQPMDSNVNDLISYIEYNNFSVSESKLYSVFDYLYNHYTESRMQYLKKHRRISRYDSENLMYALLCDTLREEEYTQLGIVCHMPLRMVIRDPNLLDDAACQYALHPATHIDFLLYNRISKQPVLAVEVDGYAFHKAGTAQAGRDEMKNHILELYHIPLLRFATNGSGEKEKLIQKLNELLKKQK